MGRMFHPDSPAVRLLSNVADLIALNVIWLICCVPVVTIGPATTAMYCVVRQIAQKNWPPVLKTFFREFRNNFKQSLLVFLALLIPVVLVGVYLILAVSGSLDRLPAIKFLSYLAIMLVGFVCSYVYPLLACFDNTVGHTLKNAILLPLINPLWALIVTTLNMLPVLLFLLNPALMIRCSFFWLMIGGALTALINIKILDKFFQRFIPSK